MSFSEGIIGRIIASISPPQNNGIAGKIIALPPQLSSLPRAQSLEGEVVRQTDAGYVRIRTAQGDIDIQVRGQALPREGQRVQVDIPRGSPPQQVVVRPPDAPRPVQGTPAPASSPPPSTRPGETGQVTRSSALPPSPAPTPLPQAETVRPPVATAPLQSGDTVRLLPLRPAQVQALPPITPSVIIDGTVQQITTIVRAALEAVVASQNGISAQGGEITQILSRPLTGQSPLQTPPPHVSVPSSVSALPPAGTGGVLSQSPAETPPITLTTPSTQALPGGAAAPAGLPGSVSLPSGVGATLPVSPQTAQVFTIQIAAPSATTPQPTPVIPTPAQAIDARVVSILPPTATLSTLAQGTPAPLPTAPSLALSNPAQSAITLPAQVIGVTPQALPIVSLTLPGQSLPQVFVLQFPASNLAPGTQIQIVPLSTTQASTSLFQGLSQASPLPPLYDSFRPGAWPLLEDILQTLTSTAPAAAQALRATLPSPASSPAQLGTAVLIFLAATRAGDIGSWLGGARTVDALQRAGKADLSSRLSQEPGLQARGESLPGEWRAVTLPVFYDGQAQKIILFTRQEDPGGERENDEGRQTRFIFDLDLTRMGAVQLDGLVRGKRLDLIVRTQAPLSEGMRQTMRQAYTAALDATELHGELGFQGDPQNWVQVIARAPLNLTETA